MLTIDTSTSVQTHSTSVVERMRTWAPAPRIATLAIAGASIAVASATFFARQLTDAGISPVAVAFYRYAISAVVMIRFLALSPPKRRATCWGLAAGATAGVGWIAYVDSVDRGDLAVAGVAYMTYPVFTLVVCRILFRRHSNLRSMMAGVLVVIASMIALGPSLSAGFSPMLFVAPATFGFGVAVLTEKLGQLDPFERMSVVAAGATVALGPLVVSMPAAEVLPGDVSDWLWVVGIGVGCALIPMTVYGAAAPSIGAARSAVAGAVELPTVFLIGALLYGESIRIEHLVAFVIIAAAIALTPSARTIHVLPEVDDVVVRNMARPAAARRDAVGLL